MTWHVQRPSALLLDAGNTLVYLDHERLHELAALHDVEVSPQRLRDAEAVAKRRYEALMAEGVPHEQGWDIHMRVLYESAGLAPSIVPRVVETARAEHDEYNLWRKVPPGLPEALTRAQAAGIRLAVVSNAEGKLRSLLTRVGLDHYFEFVLDSGLEGVRKPDPEIFRRALARLAVAPQHALYAGDIPNVDVAGARAAGMDAVLIDTLDHYPDYRDAPRFASVSALLLAMDL